MTIFVNNVYVCNNGMRRCTILHVLYISVFVVCGTRYAFMPPVFHVLCTSLLFTNTIIKTCAVGSSINTTWVVLITIIFIFNHYIYVNTYVLVYFMYDINKISVYILVLDVESLVKPRFDILLIPRHLLGIDSLHM